ncbi:hypothetical protein [Micromonospora sp. NPDC005305]|uniref:hypothetical protein n=1 Tax=Micromonospora sp. NPDC005305 TaxID=3156875 RepID=UPI0033A95B45
MTIESSPLPLRSAQVIWSSRSGSTARTYLTPVGWTLVYGLTRWTIMNIWGEGPDAAQLG